MAFIRGSDARVVINNGTDRDISDFVNSVSISRESQNIDITMLGDTFQENQQNLKGATITISGFYDSGSGANTPDNVFGPALLADTLLLFDIQYNYAAGASSRRKYAGSCRVASYELNIDVQNLIAYSVTLNVTTAVGVTTV